MSGLAAVFHDMAAKAAEFDTLLAGARQAVEQRTADFVKAGEPAIGKDAAAAIMGYSVPTLERRLAEKNPPPHYKDSGKITFFASELRAYKAHWRIGIVPSANQDLNHASAT